MDVKDKIDIFIAIITCIGTIASIVIAVYAIHQTNKQIKQSNKQNLFNDRVKSYLIIKGLLDLYTENKKTIEEEKKDEVYVCCDMTLEWLVNNSYLETMGKIASNPSDLAYRRDFLMKDEELKHEAEKIKFLFDEEINTQLYDFISAYEQLIYELYKYCILFKKIEKLKDDVINKVKLNGLEEIAKQVHEEDFRKELFSKFNNLIEKKKVLDDNNIITKMEMQIKL